MNPRAWCRLPLWTAVILAAWSLPAVAGNIYKWVDAQGNVHYSDRPGAGNARRIPLHAAPAPDPDAAKRRARERKLLHVFDEEHQERRAAQTKAAKLQAQRKQRCAQAKRRQYVYQHAHYLYEEGKNGSRRILTDAEHARALKGAAAAVKRWCSTP